MRPMTTTPVASHRETRPDPPFLSSLMASVPHVLALEMPLFTPPTHLASFGNAPQNPIRVLSLFPSTPPFPRSSPAAIFHRLHLSPSLLVHRG